MKVEASAEQIMARQSVVDKHQCAPTHLRGGTGFRRVSPSPRRGTTALKTAIFLGDKNVPLYLKASTVEGRRRKNCLCRLPPV